MIDSFLISEKLSIFEYPRKEEVFQSVIYIDFDTFHFLRQISVSSVTVFGSLDSFPIFLDAFIY